MADLAPRSGTVSAPGTALLSLAALGLLMALQTRRTGAPRAA
jgi:hypothetical protein